MTAAEIQLFIVSIVLNGIFAFTYQRWIKDLITKKNKKIKFVNRIYKKYISIDDEVNEIWDVIIEL